MKTSVTLKLETAALILSSVLSFLWSIVAGKPVHSQQYIHAACTTYQHSPSFSIPVHQHLSCRPAQDSVLIIKAIDHRCSTLYIHEMAPICGLVVKIIDKEL